MREAIKCKDCGKDTGSASPRCAACEKRRREDYERREGEGLCRVPTCERKRVEGWATCEGHAGVEIGEDVVESFFPSDAGLAERGRRYRLFKRLK